MLSKEQGLITDRIPEPELMDEISQVKAYAEADFSSTDQAMVERIRSVLPGSSPKRILDLGCGPGNIAFLVAAAFPGAQVVGFDGAPHMIRYAQDRTQTTHRHLTNLRFEVMRLPSEADFYQEKFDLIVSNSLLHHLHEPAVLWEEVKRAAAPGAFFFVADLKRPETFEEAQRIRETYAGDAPAVLKHDFYCSLLASFSVAEIEGQLKETGFEGFRVEVPTDRHVYVYGSV